MSSVLGVMIAITFTALLGSLVFWVVGRLNLGLNIKGFRAILGTALTVALISYLVDGLLNWIGLPGGDITGAVVHFVVTVLVLLGADWLVPDVEVNGIWGAVIAALALAVGNVLFFLAVVLLIQAWADWRDTQSSWMTLSAEGGPAGGLDISGGNPGNFQVAIDWANRPLGAVIFGMILAIAILFLGRWLVRMVTRYASRSLERAHVDPMVVRFLSAIIRIGLFVAIIIAALNAAGIHTTSLTALLASAGVAIGLALKDSLSNVAAGLMILVNRPYHVGDYVEAGGVEGFIREVGVFNTLMHTADNIKLYVPNATIVNGNIKNYSDTKTRRIDLEIGIGYDADLGLAREILLEIMTSHPDVLENPDPTVTVIELGTSAINLAVRPWVPAGVFFEARGELLEVIVTRFAEAGISIPYPTQEVILHQD